MRGKSGGREAVFSAILRAGRAFAKAAAEGQVEVAGRREMGPAWCGLGVGREWQEAEDDCLGLPWVCRVLEHFSLTALKLECLCFVSPATSLGIPCVQVLRLIRFTRTPHANTE